jgi:hypothetical protein
MAANTPEPGSTPTGSTPAASSSPPTSSAVPTAAPAPATAPAKAATPARPAAPAPLPKPAGSASGGANGSLILLSLLAVLIALGASAVAVYSLDQARSATSRANEAFDTANRAVAPTPTKAAAAPPASTPKPTSTPSPARVFVAELVRSPLKVPAVASPCASVYVDVDKMVVGDLAGHEFYISNCVGPLSVHVDRTSGAVPTTTNPTPELCASQITSDTVTNELIMPVINGLTFCLLTNKADAAQQSLPQRLAIVEVTGVGADNSIQLVVSTWRVPAP